MSAPSQGPTSPIRHPWAWVRLLGGLTAVFTLFQAAATLLHSDRGQAGLVVGLVVVLALLLAEVLLFKRTPTQALRLLGFARPTRAALGLAALVGGLIVLVLPIFALATNTPLPLAPGWLLLTPGLFVQAGVAEEALFRAYLFGHLRVGRSFWHAATLGMAPFVAVHLFLFLTLPAPVAGAAVGLSVVVSFPLAHLFELGRGTVWAPALVHAVVQGAIKVVEITSAASPALLVVWIVASAGLPYLVFLVRRPPPPVKVV